MTLSFYRMGHRYLSYQNQPLFTTPSYPVPYARKHVFQYHLVSSNDFRLTENFLLAKIPATLSLEYCYGTFKISLYLKKIHMPRVFSLKFIYSQEFIVFGNKVQFFFNLPFQGLFRALVTLNPTPEQTKTAGKPFCILCPL